MCHDCSGSHTCCNKKRDGCSGCPSSISCGGCQGGCCRGKRLTPLELELLFRLQQIPFLPLARFLLKSSRSPHLCSVALAPVYLLEEDDSLETVKETGRALLSLEEAGLVTLDYDIPLQGGSNALYAQSPLYQEFVQVAAQGSALPGAVFDQPALEMGSMAVTPRGLALADHLQNL